MKIDKSYGIRRQPKETSNLELILEELKIKGYTVLENILNVEDLKICRRKLDDIYELQQKKVGNENLISINEENLVRAPLIYDDYFIGIASNVKIIKLVKAILGDLFILHLQNGIINKQFEEHHQSKWHRDLPYQEFVSSKPLAIGALYCIDDFTLESGGTIVVPFSHKLEIIPSKKYIEQNKVQIIARAGSVILFDSMIFHRSGINTSTFTRRAINNVYVVPIIKQQINLPIALNGKHSENEYLANLLGYTTDTPADDMEWRNRRLKKIKK
jgi:ectoine hydroxylase-related dioxygenase (phytanoyl-CoA dioxygenase family)